MLPLKSKPTESIVVSGTAVLRDTDVHGIRDFLQIISFFERSGLGEINSTQKEADAGGIKDNVETSFGITC